MRASKLITVAVSNILVSCIGVAGLDCKCIPTSPCWPSPSIWTLFSLTLSSPSALIHNTPLAISCYPGPLFSPSECAAIDFTNSSFLLTSPVGYGYPLNLSCPALNLTSGAQLQRDVAGTGKQPETCTLGNDPVMTVNATTIEDVVNALKFAGKWNVRVAIKNTGHDLLGRSLGFGSLEIWLHYLKLGISFEEKFIPKSSCSAETWKGHAYTINGGYTWGDIYPDAASRGVIVVGGSDPTLSCLGGWMQGGGHSPAVHNYGLGADQLLSAQVILADGSIVTASPCQNQDLFFAIRGGGGGTYGIVISTTVKAYPTVSVTSQTLAIAPLIASGFSDFMSAVSTLYAAFPDLNDQGYNGYGAWSVSSGMDPIFADFTTGYAHSMAIFNSSISEFESIFAPTLSKLQAFNTTLLISVAYATQPTYGALIESGSSSPVGAGTFALGSRLLGRDALSRNFTALQEMVNTIGGSAEQHTSNNLCLVGGGQVFADASDPNSGVNPAWRKAYLHNIVTRQWTDGTDAATIQEIKDDITFTKVGAMKKLSPGGGCYMNEADVNDPDFLDDFYGSNAEKLSAIKQKYDPKSLLFCQTCIGSEKWEVGGDGDGALCSA